MTGSPLLSEIEITVDFFLGVQCYGHCDIPYSVYGIAVLSSTRIGPFFGFLGYFRSRLDLSLKIETCYRPGHTHSACFAHKMSCTGPTLLGSVSGRQTC